MTAITVDEDNHRFAVGTCSMKEPNSIHVVNYSEDTNSVDLEVVLAFEQGEIWELKASPYDKTILAVSSIDDSSDQAILNIVKLPEQGEK
jgi:hypothetical protein